MASSTVYPLIMLLMILCLFYGTHESVTINDRIEVHIFNELPRNTSRLVVHCFSGDDDFGNHSLAPGQSFYWIFRTNLFGSTQYFCHLWWGSKQQGFVAFNSNWVIAREFNNYVAKQDAIYVNHIQSDHDRALKLYAYWA